ncbi:MAG: hypothetical protein DWQ01_06740 [Planctomycetota bacterium]|nr:MAG: hypothetical protein DWQ01_06740 [Planctomycetota bacterium]
MLGCHDEDTVIRRKNRSQSGATTFSHLDLAGDWTGILIPDNPTFQTTNLYLRWDDFAELFEAATGAGDEWMPSNASLFSSMDVAGETAVMLQEAGDDLAALNLAMNLSEDKNRLTGTAEIRRYGVLQNTGTVELTRSLGPGHFQVSSHLAGSWTGTVSRNGFQRPVTLNLDELGSVLGGSAGPRNFDTSGANTGIFTFSNDAVGRLDHIVIHSIDGTTQTVGFWLVDDSGTYMGGPGFDSNLGNRGGLVHLSKVSKPN